MAEWLVLSKEFTGWTLSEIKELSPRERRNWLTVAKEYGKMVRKNAGQ